MICEYTVMVLESIQYNIDNSRLRAHNRIVIQCPIEQIFESISYRNMLNVHISSSVAHNLEDQEQYLCTPLNCDGWILYV